MRAPTRQQLRDFAAFNLLRAQANTSFTAALTSNMVITLTFRTPGTAPNSIGISVDPGTTAVGVTVADTPGTSSVDLGESVRIAAYDVAVEGGSVTGKYDYSHDWYWRR